MIRTACLFVPLACLLAAPLAAEPGLPAPETVERVLAEHPSVTAAYARLEAARARAEGLRKGSYEFTVQGSYTRRDVSGGNEFNEYDAQLSRPIRLPGKARLDRAIGALGTEVAENVAEDARHEAALLLAAHWFNWLSASAQAKVLRDRNASCPMVRSGSGRSSKSRVRLDLITCLRRLGSRASSTWVRLTKRWSTSLAVTSRYGPTL